MKWQFILAFLFQITLFHAQDTDYADQTIAVSAEDYQETKSEKIYNFHSDIVIDKEGLVTVTEKIKVYANGNEIKRGIFRSLPLKLNINGKKLKAKYKIVSVLKNGQTEPYKTEDDNLFLKIYVGDKDIFLEPNVYDYEIKYTTTKQIGFFDNYDEFYWNVSGTDWDFPIDSISAQVTLPNDATIIQNSCYTGVFGSTEKNCTSKSIDSHTMYWEAKGLGSHEGLTIAAGFNKGVFLPPPPPNMLEKYGILCFLGAAFLGLLTFLYSQWRKYGVDPEKPTVYPQFNVPENLSPAALGYLHHDRLQSNFVTSSIVNLAIKGYLRIEESQDSGIFGIGRNKIFKLIKLKNSDSTLATEELAFFDDFFAKKSVVTITGSYNSRIESAMSHFETDLLRNYNPILKEGNNLVKITKPAFIIIGLYLVGLLGSLLINIDEIGKVFLGLILLAAVSLLTTIAVSIMRNAKSKKFKVGCITIFIGFFIGSFLLSFILPVFLFSFNSDVDTNFKCCYLFLITSSIILVIYSYLIKRPSEEKLRIKSLIEGFKMYMGAAENEQLKFHNPPNFTPQLFEQYLPYAIVLGVDKIWGERFASLLQNSSMDYNTGWYMGGMMNVSSLGSSLNSSLTDSLSNASTEPSSSSSSSSGGSGSSGSSGGGSSGGGGGGGGGGGW
ncbi:DUF2207 domain-containing protein [Chryseobacterium sp.]|uniref:DUF2207 domain-containing protein n=1 Tax=Chryseobacterium sp. TaxID=1871047 RepID=UPI00388F6876